jgi:hypothetical protein
MCTVSAHLRPYSRLNAGGATVGGLNSSGPLSWDLSADVGCCGTKADLEPRSDEPAADQQEGTPCDEAHGLGRQQCCGSYGDKKSEHSQRGAKTS